MDWAKTTASRERNILAVVFGAAYIRELKVITAITKLQRKIRNMSYTN